jgi:oligopeptide/dipeptide ABC transporter ATP-binding protein
VSRTLLEASNVSIRFARRVAPAVNDVDLTVEEGEAIGIVGESGSGKTSLARALIGVLTPHGGQVRVAGKAWRDVARNAPERRSVQMVFQDPHGSLNPHLSPRNAVAEVYQVWDRLDRRQAEAAAESVLREVGLAPAFIDSRPARLSGGQCQRVAIARALASNPQVLIADEPTSSLDASVQAQILNLLADLKASRKLSLILVSHDLRVVRWLTERVLVMYRGQVVEEGPTAAIFSDPAHPYTRALIASAPTSSRPLPITSNDVDEQHGCVFASRCVAVEDDCLPAQPPLGLVRGRRVACLHPVPSGSSERPTASGVS